MPVLIPELPPDANDLVVTITIDKAVSPYLTKWYNREKEAGETPSAFVVRKLMHTAVMDYISVANTAFSYDYRDQVDALLALID